MNLFGLTIGRTKTVAELETKDVSAVGGRGWWPIINEAFTGAWQRNIEVRQDLVLSFHAVFACLTLIASDFSKLRVRLVEKDGDGIWTETSSPAYSPVLYKPNSHQNRIQFWESYILSKLTRGNTYVLKQRDNRNVVTALYVLNPDRCGPMVADDGSVFYALRDDKLNGLGGFEGTIMVPAREIIHDRMNTLFHPLCGMSPIYACGLSATQGLQIQNHSARFFRNNSQPGGILTADKDVKITDAESEKMKKRWQENFGGDNFGKVAVLGGGLKYVQLAMTATDAQLIEQLKLSAEQVCGAFHVPPYKIGVGPAPLNNNVQSLNVEYYAQCLQKLFEDAELCLDEGLGIGDGVVVNGRILGTEFDIDNLLRMDTAAQMVALRDAVGAGVMSPDEARGKLNLPPTPGGDGPYLQQQNYSLAALSKRDALPDPFGTAPADPSADPPLALPPPAAKGIDIETDDLAAAGRAHLAMRSLRKHLGMAS